MVVCFNYGVFTVTNIARIRRTISCYCARKRRSSPINITFKLQMELLYQRQKYIYIHYNDIEYRCSTSTIFEEVGIEIAMCCNIQQSTMTFHTRYDTMTSTYQVVDRMVSVVYSLPSSLLICILLYLLLIRRQHDTIRFKTIKEGRRLWI